MKSSVLLTFGLFCLTAMPVFSSATPLEGDDNTNYLSDLNADERLWDDDADNEGFAAADEDYSSDLADADALDEQQAFLDDREISRLMTANDATYEEVKYECARIRERMQAGCGEHLLQGLSQLKRYLTQHFCKTDADLLERLCPAKVPHLESCIKSVTEHRRLCPASVVARLSTLGKRERAAKCLRLDAIVPTFCGKWRPPQ